MDEIRRDDDTTRPGIPEALHPETGNGALLESDPHAALLRSPDPLKAFDVVLSYKVEAEAEAKLSPFEGDVLSEAEIGRGDENEKAKVEAEAKAKVKLSPFEGDVLSEAEIGRGDENEEVKTEAEAKAKAKLSPFEGDVLSEAEIGRGDENEEAEEKAKVKSPKAGKRIRKAVKSLQKQEAQEETKEPAQLPTMVPDTSLSPFTQWLKALRGSEYVHPYDDDFAIEQSGHMSREGMSETFADLLAAQGHKDRAKEMYQRLMEKYPEKSSFFAAKIKALE